MAEAARQEIKPLLENKGKIVLLHASSGHKIALKEVLSDPAVQSRLADTKAAREVQILARFYDMLNNEPDRAYYGYPHVSKANERLAIESLLLSDNLFRYSSY